MNTKQTEIHSQKQYYKTMSPEIIFSVTAENAAPNVGVVPAYMCVVSEAKEWPHIQCLIKNSSGHQRDIGYFCQSIALRYDIVLPLKTHPQSPPTDWEENRLTATVSIGKTANAILLYYNENLYSTVGHMVYIMQYVCEDCGRLL